jgi:hypothetical protein
MSVAVRNNEALASLGVEKLLGFFGQVLDT